jgi:hypothetical protein
VMPGGAGRCRHNQRRDGADGVADHVVSANIARG